jgi:hypothetical protein
MLFCKLYEAFLAQFSHVPRRRGGLGRVFFLGVREEIGERVERYIGGSKDIESIAAV